MIKRLAAICYHFLLEFTLLLLLTFFFYIESKEIPPILTLLGLCLGGLIPLVLLIEKFKHNGKWIYIFVILPLLISVGTNTHFSIYSVGTLGLFIFWRGLSLYSDYTGHSDSLFLFLSFFLGILVIIYSAVLHYPYQYLIVFLLILQIILVLSGLFFSKWSTITEDKMKFVLYFIKILGGAAIVGAAVTFILKYIQTIFFGIFSALAYIFSYLTIPVIKILKFIINLFFRGERKPQILESDVSMTAGKYQEHNNMTLNFVYLILVAAGIAILVYYIHKKRIKHLESGSYLMTVEMSEGVQRQERGLFWKNRVKPPGDPIRREIYQMEKFAYKLSLGRLPFETLDEWWERIGLTHTEDTNKIYDKIRYGMLLSSAEEQAQFKDIISHLKKQLKEKAKIIKQETEK